MKKIDRKKICSKYTKEQIIGSKELQDMIDKDIIIDSYLPIDFNKIKNCIDGQSPLPKGKGLRREEQGQLVD